LCLPAALLSSPGVGYLVRRRVAGAQQHREHWVCIAVDSASCSDCHFCQNMLLPCRHVFAANRVQWPSGQLFISGQCHRRWLLDEPVVRAVTGNDLVRIPMAPLSRRGDQADDAAQLWWTELSHNKLHINFMASAARLSSFMRDHGEVAYVSVQSYLETLVKYYSVTPAPGLKAPQQVRHTLHTSFTYLCHASSVLFMSCHCVVHVYFMYDLRSVTSHLTYQHSKQARPPPQPNQLSDRSASQIASRMLTYTICITDVHVTCTLCISHESITCSTRLPHVSCRCIPQAKRAREVNADTVGEDLNKADPPMQRQRGPGTKKATHATARNRAGSKGKRKKGTIPQALSQQ
jgi:hypothetical protein